MTDLLVIGAGLSGLMAAHAAAAAGMRVQIVTKGLGSIHWSAGTIDLLGEVSSELGSVVRRPLERIENLSRFVSGHPYSLVPFGEIRETLDTFVALSEEVGLPYGRSAHTGCNLMLPSPAGAVRPTFLAPRAQLAGDLDRPEPMLIVGFRGGHDFYPELIAENLARQGFTARAAFLPRQVITQRGNANSVQLASELDNPQRGKELAAALRREVRPGERVGLPALLGLARHLELLRELENEVGAPVFEIPTLPPSVPGWRLFSALRRHLEGRGVRIEVGVEVVGAETRSGADSANGIKWVESLTTARPRRHEARKYLLATGGFLGGGFGTDMNGRTWEAVFNLPVTAPSDRSEWFRPQFLDPTGHPLFKAGVKVGKTFQPAGEGGCPLYSNLWAAGGLLAGCDPVQERSLEGVALVTGLAAGKAAAKED